MLKKFLLVVVLLLGILGAYYFISSRQSSSRPLDSAKDKLTVQLNEYSDSGQSGTAVLTDLGNGKTLVAVELSGTEYPDPQPAHIHSGGCPRIGPVLFGLTSLVGNRSETTIDKSLADVLSSSDTLNINVHHSEADFKTYTACGDVEK